MNRSWSPDNSIPRQSWSKVVFVWFCILLRAEARGSVSPFPNGKFQLLAFSSPEFNSTASRKAHPTIKPASNMKRFKDLSSAGAVNGEGDDASSSPAIRRNESRTMTGREYKTLKKPKSEGEMPTDLWNIPNILTMARVIAIPIFSALFFTDYAWRNAAAAGIFAGAAVTDWLDGYLARKWQITSPFGAFLDPVADKLMVSTALILLTGRLQDWTFTVCCAVILAREIGVSALREWMAQIGERGKVKVGFAGKLKTTCQMVALVILLLTQPGADVWLVPAQAGFRAGMGLMYLSAVLTVTSGWGYLKAAWPALMGKSSSA
mmetsp:Transcript_7505/g.11904  ORF Transcript_7505/g.11904 Transcript_7505/m.11904 type:complete len:320 (-) Transcript_7505:151-1110(-)